MSFILRQITKRVGAPDIVREKPLAAAEPVIGRGSDCDIQLTDLAVSLRHAVVKQTAPGKVSVDSLGAENFEADGKFVHNASLDLANSPVLVFGSHVLALTPGENGDILVTATARENTAAARNRQRTEAFLLAEIRAVQPAPARLDHHRRDPAGLPDRADRPVRHRSQPASDDFLGRGPAMVQRAAVARASFPGEELRGLPPPAPLSR